MRKSEICTFNVLVEVEVNGVFKIKYRKEAINFDQVTGVTMTNVGPRGITLDEYYVAFITNDNKNIVTDISQNVLIYRLFTDKNFQSNPRWSKLKEWFGGDIAAQEAANNTRLESGVFVYPIKDEKNADNDNVGVSKEPEITIEKETEEEIVNETQQNQQEVIRKDKLLIVRNRGVTPDNRILVNNDARNLSLWTERVENPRYPEESCRLNHNTGVKITHINSSKFRGKLIEFPNGGEAINWPHLEDHPDIAYRLNLPFKSNTKVYLNGMKKIWQYFYDKAGHIYTLSLNLDKDLVVKKFISDVNNYSTYTGGLDYSPELDYMVVRFVP
jgi:hypothetical protein